MISLDASKKEDFSLERTEWKTGQNLEHELLSLFRIRDFVSQLLSYPIGRAEASALKKWISKVLEFNANYSKPVDSNSETWFLYFRKTKEKVDVLLVDNPLTYMKGLIPDDIITKIEDGKKFTFNENAAPALQELMASGRTSSEGKQVHESTNAADLTTEDVLDFAADLAVRQLLQVLLSGNNHSANIHHVRFSTRNVVEKRAVIKKIEESLKDRDKKLKIDQTFVKVLRIDASKYEKDAEEHVPPQIAEHLELMTTTIGEGSEDNNILLTRSIEEEMMREKCLVLLVDGDGKRKLNPQKVGLSKSKLEGVLVLITTESESSAQDNDELTRAMDLEIRTEDHLLPWDLFWRNVGCELISSSTAIRSAALDIVKGCRCHILSIGLVAKSLKNCEDVKFCQLTLDNLRRSFMTHIHNLNGTHIYNSTRMSKVIGIIWDGISFTEKHCLKHCLSVPKIKDGVVNHALISGWTHAELVYTREEAEQVLQQLVDRHILLQFQGSRSIRLPEESYDIIALLLRGNPLNIQQGKLGLAKAPNSGQWYAASEIDLSENKVSELPPSPNCPTLKRLWLQGNHDLTEIPPLFFNHMPMLEELDLSRTSIRDLPSSFGELTKLQRFYLAGCELFAELPQEIVQLENLDTIDLQGTQITHLPKEIRKLAKLDTLKLSFDKYHGHIGGGKIKSSVENSSSIMIPMGVISNLTNLWDLSIDVEPDDEQWHQNLPLILPEILGLKRLRNLSLYIPEVELLKPIIPRNAKRLGLKFVDHGFRFLIGGFRFVVGHHMQRFISHVPPALEADQFKPDRFFVDWHERKLRFINGVDVPMGIKMVLPFVEYLFLDRHMTIKNLHELELENLKKLRNCVLAECNEMLTIVDARVSTQCSLYNLESLKVFYMKNLRSIWEVPAPPNYFSFSGLRQLELHTCPKLTTIFALHFLVSLSNLEELTVEDCPQVTTIISDQSPGIKDQFLPSLKKVTLVYLPELVSISNGLCIAPDLEKIGFYYCPKLETLSSKELSSEKLKVIKGERQWWEALKWSADEWGQSTPPHNLNHIFSPISEATDVMTQLRNEILSPMDEVTQRRTPPFKESNSGIFLMSGLEIAVPAVTEMVGFGLRESYNRIRSIVADSKILEGVYYLLHKDLQSLLALKNDIEREVQRHQEEKERISAYSLWAQRVSEVVAEVQKLRTKYETKRLPKWLILQRSHLSEEMKKMRDQVHQLIDVRDENIPVPSSNNLNFWDDWILDS